MIREGESASGNQMFTLTDIPQHVVLVDENGATYTMRGATWFGGATNDNTGAEVVTATHNLEIIARAGGVADSIRLIERLRDGQLISHESARVSRHSPPRESKSAWIRGALHHHGRRFRPTYRCALAAIAATLPRCATRPTMILVVRSPNPGE